MLSSSDYVKMASKQWKAASRNNNLQAALAFFLPIMIFLAAVRFDPSSYVPIQSVFVNEAEAVRKLSSMMSSDKVLNRMSAVREILSMHLDPFFFIALIVGKLTQEVFSMIVLIRIGLCGLTSFMFLRKRVKISAAASLLLSFCYCFMPTALTFGLIPALHNMMILLPLVMYVEDVYLCQMNLKNFGLLTAASVLMTLSGPYGLICGVPFILGTGLLMSLCRRGRVKQILIEMGGVIPTQIMAVGISAIVQFPRFHNAVIDLKPDSYKVRYTFFDFLTTTLDGRSSSTLAIGAPIFSLSIFVLITTLLFLMNPRIPFRVKAASLLLYVVCHLSVAVPAVNSLVSFFPDASFDAGRIICLAMLVIFMSAVSVRNMAGVKEYQVCLAEVAVIALVMISNSSANETSPSEFTIFFSVGAALITGGLLLKYLRGNRVAIKVLFCLALLGMAINLWHISSKNISTPASVIGFDAGNMNSAAADTVDFRISDGLLPLYNGEDSYLLITADLSYLTTDSVPEAINNAARAALLGVVYDHIDYNVIYNHGASHYGTDMFTYDPVDGRCELILGVDLGDADRCIVTSGLRSRVYLTESYPENDKLTVFADPFVYEVIPETSTFSLRLTSSPDGIQNGVFSVWTLNEEGMQQLQDAVKPFNGRKIEGGDFDWLLSFEGEKSVITSLAYDPGIKATVGGRSAVTYDYHGLLAVLFESDASGIMPEIRFKADNSDLVTGAFISLLSVVSLAGLFYISHTHKNKGPKENHA